MKGMPLAELVRAKVQRLVEERQFSLQALAPHLGIGESGVSKLLHGTNAISLEHIEGFCRAFQITPSELVAEPNAQIQVVRPLEAQLLTHFREMSELQRMSLLSILDRPLPPRTRRRERLGHPPLTDEQQVLIDLYARSNEQARSGILKILRGSAKAGDAERDHPGKT